MQNNSFSNVSFAHSNNYNLSNNNNNNNQHTRNSPTRNTPNLPRKIVNPLTRVLDDQNSRFHTDLADATDALFLLETVAGGSTGRLKRRAAAEEARTPQEQATWARLENDTLSLAINLRAVRSSNHHHNNNSNGGGYADDDELGGPSTLYRRHAARTTTSDHHHPRLNNETKSEFWYAFPPQFFAKTNGDYRDPAINVNNNNVTAVSLLATDIGGATAAGGGAGGGAFSADSLLSNTTLLLHNNNNHQNQQIDHHQHLRETSALLETLAPVISLSKNVSCSCSNSNNANMRMMADDDNDDEMIDDEFPDSKIMQLVTSGGGGGGDSETRRENKNMNNFNVLLSDYYSRLTSINHSLETEIQALDAEAHQLALAQHQRDVVRREANLAWAGQSQFDVLPQESSVAFWKQLIEDLERDLRQIAKVDDYNNNTNNHQNKNSPSTTTSTKQTIVGRLAENLLDRVEVSETSFEELRLFVDYVHFCISSGL